MTIDVVLAGVEPHRRTPMQAGEVVTALVGLARRQAAARDGRCPCGGVVVMPNRSERRRAAREGRGIRVRLEHEAGCAAVAPALERLLGGRM